MHRALQRSRAFPSPSATAPPRSVRRGPVGAPAERAQSLLTLGGETVTNAEPLIAGRSLDPYLPCYQGEYHHRSLLSGSSTPLSLVPDSMDRRGWSQGAAASLRLSVQVMETKTPEEAKCGGIADLRTALLAVPGAPAALPAVPGAPAASTEAPTPAASTAAPSTPSPCTPPLHTCFTDEKHFAGRSARQLLLEDVSSLRGIRQGKLSALRGGGVVTVGDFARSYEFRKFRVPWERAARIQAAAEREARGVERGGEREARGVECGAEREAVGTPEAEPVELGNVSARAVLHSVIGAQEKERLQCKNARTMEQTHLWRLDNVLRDVDECPALLHVDPEFAAAVRDSSLFDVKRSAACSEAATCSVLDLFLVPFARRRGLRIGREVWAGRRVPGSSAELAGKMDYALCSGPTVRVIIEAKEPTETSLRGALLQGWLYALKIFAEREERAERAESAPSEEGGAHSGEAVDSGDEVDSDGAEDAVLIVVSTSWFLWNVSAVHSRYPQHPLTVLEQELPDSEVGRIALLQHVFDTVESLLSEDPWVLRVRLECAAGSAPADGAINMLRALSLE